jgi:type 1 glutamine amidotransferase/sugar phosphate isomerase/epimerase
MEKQNIDFFGKTLKGILTAFLAFYMTVNLFAQKIYSSGEAEAIFYPISNDFKKQVENALPVKLPVLPAKKRKLLVFNLHVSKDREPLAGHYSIPYANYAILEMGEKMSGYETYFSNDTLVFQPEILNQFDAICFNNTGGVLFDDPDLRKNLLDYVYGGGGFIGIHATAATFVQYPVYDQFPAFGIMLGGYENGGHPWKENEWITIQVEENDHPLNQSIGYKKFEISDEVFQFSEPYSRDHLRVLMTIDISRTDTSLSRRILPERRADGDLAMSWIREYGRGRVYYSSFGDNPHINWDTRILNHYLSGIQYALGDLKAPATPSQKLTPAIRATERSGWEFGLSTYSFKDNTLMETIDQAASLGYLKIEAYFDQVAGLDNRKKFDADLSENELYRIREKLIENDIQISNYYIHDFPSTESECKKLFEFGKKMGVVTFVSEPRPSGLDLIEKYCREFDIRLAIHNHGQKLSPQYWKPEQLMKEIDGRSPYIGACGDVGYWIRSGIDPLQAIEVLGDRLMVLHVHDLDKDNSKGHDVPWGEGIARLDQLFKVLHSGDHQELFVGLEYAYHFGQSLPEIKKSIDFFNNQIVLLAGEE